MTESHFYHFFDDAAIFPPGLAPLKAAVHAHIRRSGDPRISRFIGPLILPLEKVDEALQHAGTAALNMAVISGSQQLPQVSLLIDRLSAPSSNTEVTVVEVKPDSTATQELEKVATFSTRHPSLDVYVELLHSQIDHDTILFLKNAGLRLKFRTGGIEAALFPSASQLFEVLRVAVENKLPFKLTAGLHRAIRYTDQKTGFRHFGFLNIAAATAMLANHNQAEAVDLLNSNNAKAVTAAVLDDDDWRTYFCSFGTCSVIEPAETLANLGVFPPNLANLFI